MKDSNVSEVSPDIPAESAVEVSSQEDQEESTGTEAQQEEKVVIEEEPEEPAIAEDESLPASQNAEEEAQIDDQASLAPSTDATPADSPPDQADPSPLKIGRGRKPLGKRVAEILSGEVPKSENDGKPAKRLPGRRRAPHANPKIEAALRRQLHLHSSIRSRVGSTAPTYAAPAIVLATTDGSSDAAGTAYNCPTYGPEHTRVSSNCC
ncbi:hypothetical protein M8818_005965 [Zalaria obscura]|uniref:Uncharacterized protein n=1 Tax=Zalaria obscura TaxID=2024903 RepID=A0ACC3S7L0_9PEZI